MKRGIKRPKLVDAREIHKKHPTTFDVPDDDDMARIAPGWMVKLSANRERFWVEVNSVVPELTGVVRNDLITPKLRRGDVVAFKRNNVYDIEKPRQGNTWNSCAVQ